VQPLTVGARPMWREDEVLAWINSRPAREYKSKSKSTNPARNSAGAITGRTTSQKGK
jgi:hypothetical protein